MEIKKQENDDSLGEFMKVSLEGFSWAENIYQKVESICAENYMVQNPGKYVDVVGEHFRKVIDTVVNDLCDHADDVLELFSELSFGHSSLVKASGKKAEELDGHNLHDKPSSTCICEGTAFAKNSFLEHYTLPIVMECRRAGLKKDTLDETLLTRANVVRASSIKDSFLEHGDGSMVYERSNVEIEENVSTEKYDCVRLAPESHSVEVLNQVQLPSEPQLLNKKDVSNGILLETHTIEAERLNFPAKNFSNAAAAGVDLTASLSLTEVNSSMIHQSVQAGGPSPFNSIYILDIESEDSSHLMASDGSELAPEEGPKWRENSTKYENLNNFSTEDFGNSSIFSLKNEDLTEFEDVKLDDDFKTVKVDNDWDDIINSEIALISSLAAKKESSKTKLKKMFTSRWRPSNRSRKLVNFQDDFDLHSKTPSEFDWELL